MSATNGNGHAQKLSELREQTRLARAASRLAQAEHERQLWESFGGAGAFAFGHGDLLNPYGFRRDDLGQIWLPLNQSGVTSKKDGRNYPFFQTDSDLDAMRGLAYWLTTKNDLAIGTVTTFQNYTVKQGYDWQAKPEKGYEEDEKALRLAKQVQRVIDRDSDLNNLPEREGEAFWRTVRDGDGLMRHFRQGDGTTLHRPIRAEQLRDPGNLGPHAAFGVETDEHDVETVLAYHVTYDGTNYERVPAAEISHLKRNVDSEIKRGVSDFFSAGEAFDDVSKLLRNMRKGGAVLAAIAWIEQFENTTSAQMSGHQANTRDQSAPRVDNPLTGRQADVQYYEPGTVLRTKKGKTYTPPPLAGNTTNFTGIVQAALRACGVRWGIPEHMISGDASNNNYASILVTGSPFVNAVECTQGKFGRFFLRWRWVAIKNACERRLIDAPFEEVERLVDVVYTAPQVAVSDESGNAQIDKQDMEAGVLSKKTRATRRNLDWEQEQKNIKEEGPPPGQAGAAGEGPAPPAPPAPLGESLSVRDEALLILLEAEQRKAGEVWQGPSGRWFTKTQAGRTVPAADPNRKEPQRKPRAKKVSVAEAHDLVRAAGADAKKLTEALLSIRAVDVQALRAELGHTKSAGGSRVKQKLIDDLVAKVTAGAPPKGGPKEEPPAQKPLPPMPRLDSNAQGEFDGYVWRGVGGESEYGGMFRGQAALGPGLYVDDSPRGAKSYGSDVRKARVKLRVLGGNTPEFRELSKGRSGDETAKAVQDAGYDGVFMEHPTGLVIYRKDLSSRVADDMKAAPSEDVGKQHWQMTAEEYLDSEHTHNWTAAERERVRKQMKGGGPAAAAALEAAQQKHEGVRGREATFGRRAGVKRALAAGKPVPPEVLADYPDLAPKAAPKAAAPMADADFAALIKRAAERGDAGHTPGVAEGGVPDVSSAAKAAQVAGSVAAGRKPHATLEGFLAIDFRKPAAWPDDASRARVNDVAKRAFALYPDAEVQMAARMGKLPGYRASKNTYEAEIEKRDPAYAEFLRDRLGAKPAGG